ncbi:MAG: VOC family protein [Opitutales bacterium]|nr:VOC family protein [Opitutales bacterium]
MNPLAIDFFLYEVNDLQRAIEFYRDTLGLSVEGEVFENCWVEFDIQPTTLALYCPKETEKRDANIGGASVAIAVESVADTIAELKQKGVEISFDVFESPACYMAYIKDPDGNGVGIHQRKDGTCG